MEEAMTDNRIFKGGLAALPVRRHLIHSFNIAFLVLAMGNAAAAADQHCSVAGICKQAAIADTPFPAARDAGMEPRIELVQYSTSPRGGVLQGPRSLTPEPMIDYGKSGLPEARLKVNVMVRENPWNGKVAASLRAGTLVVVQYRAEVPEYGKWAQIALPGRPTLGWVQDRFLDFARKDERIDIRRGVLE
jgi:hypothetical protein